MFCSFKPKKNPKKTPQCLINFTGSYEQSVESLDELQNTQNIKM